MSIQMSTRHNTVFAEADGGCRTHSGHPLASHQVKIKSEMDKRSCLGIFAEAGTGKTMIALSWIYDALINGLIEDALVICPASLVPSWELAIQRMIEFESYTSFDVEIMSDAVSILSTQSVWQCGPTKSERKFTRNGRTYHIRDGYDRPWGAIIVDESHNIGNPSSIQSITCYRLLSSCSEHRYIMTGTPDSGKYEKLYGQIRFLDPDRWRSFKEFSRECISSFDAYFKPRSYFTDRCESVKRKYGTVARLRDCFDMPSSTETDVPCPHADPDVYRDMIGMRMDGYGINPTASGVAWQKALQTCSGFYIDDDKAVHRIRTAKLNALADIIASVEGKVVVFCNYTASINSICTMLRESKVRHYRFDGSVSKPVWQDFQKDDTRVIVVQYQRGGVGIDLFASCHCVFFDMTARAVLLEQAKARIMRKGQTKPCRYYYLYTPSTIEERLMRSVRSGVDVSTSMLDEWSREERMIQAKLPLGDIS